MDSLHLNKCGVCREPFVEGDIVVAAYRVGHIFPNGSQMRLSSTSPTACHKTCNTEVTPN